MTELDAATQPTTADRRPETADRPAPTRADRPKRPKPSREPDREPRPRRAADPSARRGRRPTPSRRSADSGRRPSRRPRPSRDDAAPRPTAGGARGRVGAEAAPTRPNPSPQTGPADRRPVHRRRPPRRRRPLRLHRARRVVPRPARRLRGCRHPGRRDASRGCRRVHGRGPRPADRPTGGLPRDAGGRAARTSRSGSTRPARTRRRCSWRSARSSGRCSGREAFQEIDQVATLGGLAKWAAEPRDRGRGRRDDGRGRPPGPRWPARARPAVAARGPARRADARRRPVDSGRRTGRARQRRRDPRASSSSSPRPERPVILAGGGVLRARTSTELTRFAELLQVPVIAAWRRADVISNDHPLYLGMAGFGAPPVGPRAARRRRRPPRPRVAPQRARRRTATRCRATGLRWAHVDLVPGAATGLDARRAITVTADAKAFLKAANERLLGRAVLDAALVADAPGAQRGRSRRVGGGDRRRRDAVGRPGRPPRPDRSRRSGGSCPTTRS